MTRLTDAQAELAAAKVAYRFTNGYDAVMADPNLPRTHYALYLGGPGAGPGSINVGDNPPTPDSLAERLERATIDVGRWLHRDQN